MSSYLNEILNEIIPEKPKEVSSPNIKSNSTFIDNILEDLKKETLFEKESKGNIESFVQKKEKEALATKDDPTFFSETIRALVGGVGDATNKITGLAADAGNFLQEKMPIPYYLEFGNDNGILDKEDLNPYNWIRKMPKGANAETYIKEKNKRLGKKEGNPWALPEADANELEI